VPTTHVLIISKDCSIKPDKPLRSGGDNTLIINQSPFQFHVSEDTELEVKIENKSLTTDDLKHMAHEMVGGSNTKYYLW
jgi:hypothetical protein